MYVLTEIIAILIMLAIYMLFMHFFGKLLMKSINFRYTMFSTKDPLLDELMQQKFKELQRQYQLLKDVNLITFHSEKLKKHRMGMYNVFSNTIIINTACGTREELYGMLGHEAIHAMTKDEEAHRKMQKISNLIFLGMAHVFIIFLYANILGLATLQKLGYIQVPNYTDNIFYMGLSVTVFFTVSSIFVKREENRAKKAFHRTRDSNHQIEYLCDQGSRILMGEDYITPFFEKMNNPECDSHPSDLNRVINMKMNNWENLDDILSEIKRFS